MHFAAASFDGTLEMVIRGVAGADWTDPACAEVHTSRPLLIRSSRPRLWRGMQHNTVLPQSFGEYSIVIAQVERWKGIWAGSPGSKGVVGIRARYPEQSLRLAIVGLQVIVCQWPIFTIAI
jgi:hypothetical protein